MKSVVGENLDDLLGVNIKNIYEQLHICSAQTQFLGDSDEWGHSQMFPLSPLKLSHDVNVC